MSKKTTPHIQDHADLAHLDPRAAWRIYQMRFVDRWVGPFAPRVLRAAWILARRLVQWALVVVVLGSCNVPELDTHSSHASGAAATTRSGLS